MDAVSRVSWVSRLRLRQAVLNFSVCRAFSHTPGRISVLVSSMGHLHIIIHTIIARFFPEANRMFCVFLGGKRKSEE